MESQNIYESMYHNATFQANQTRDNESGNEAGDTTTYTDHGFESSPEGDHSYEFPLDISVLSSQKTPESQRRGCVRDNELYESYAEQIMNAQNVKIRQGIRDLAISTSTKSNNSLYCILVFSIIVLLLASIASSAYVFYQYESQRMSSCLSITQSLSYTEKRNDTISNKELRQLADEVKIFEDQLKHFKSNSTQAPTVNLREERMRSRKLFIEVKRIEKELENMEKNLVSKVLRVSTDFNNSMTQLNTKFLNGLRNEKDCDEKVAIVNSTFMAQLFNVSQVLIKNPRVGIGKCVFKTQSSNSKQNKKVSIMERNDGSSNLIGVTCCTQDNQYSFKNQSLLKVERNVNITYSCQCFNRIKCALCYWECTR